MRRILKALVAGQTDSHTHSQRAGTGKEHLCAFFPRCKQRIGWRLNAPNRNANKNRVVAPEHQFLQVFDQLLRGGVCIPIVKVRGKINRTKMAGRRYDPSGRERSKIRVGPTSRMQKFSDTEAQSLRIRSKNAPTRPLSVDPIALGRSNRCIDQKRNTHAPLCILNWDTTGNMLL